MSCPSPLTRVPTLVALALTVGGLAACDDAGTSQREVVEVGAYDRVAIEGASEATLSGSADVAPGTVLIECAHDVREVEADVQEGKLTVLVPGPDKQCHIFVLGSELDGVELSGAEDPDGFVALHLDGGGELHLEELMAEDVEVYVRGGASVEIGQLHASEVDVDMSGGGDLWLGRADADHLGIVTRGNTDIGIDDLSVGQWALDTTGNTRLDAAGTAVDADIVAAGSAEVMAMDVVAQVATIDAGGSATVELTVEDDVAVTAGGNATVSVGGDPATHTVDAGASAEVLGL
ncbi:MAG: DUF2807 domain-containing protein [Alphaproteobacteria bacterium]|nr:DUF2807 domain-containing protein [Alphaproteobacteria bacterium]